MILDWHGERVVPKAMDTSSEVQRMTIKMYFERYYKVYDWLTEHFQDREVRLLDLACGTGYGSRIFSKVGEVLGVDIDKNVVEHARDHYKTVNTSFMVGSADDRSFLESLGKFDAVISLATIEHICDHRAYLKWVNRSLRPGGVLIVSFPSTFTMDYAAPHHRRDISRRAARRLFRECGFDIIETFYQRELVDMRYVIREARTNKKMAAPPLRYWLGYYLRRPDHLIRRIYQMTAGSGILFEHQQYLLTPSADAN